jgi:hypothetical protein
MRKAEMYRSKRLAGLVLVGGAIAIALLIASVYAFPTFLTERSVGTTAARKLSADKRLKAENDIRTTLIQTLGGAVILAGAYFTWRQIQVTREGQNTDRFTSAIEHLGHSTADIRIGGIHALGRLAETSKPDRAAIARILCAFIRGHSPVTNHHVDVAGSSLEETGNPSDDDTKIDHVAASPDEDPQPPADVQAALEALGSFPEPKRIHKAVRTKGLGDADLRGASLTGNFEGAEFTGSDLRGAYCIKVQMKDTMFRWAHLEEAAFHDADLRDAKFDSSDRAIDSGAHLEGAFLYGADLRGARLVGSHLRGARADRKTRWPTDFDESRAASEGVIFDQRRAY